MSGGNTANALAIWRLHGIDVALRDAWERGAVLGGVSAGANCWFECCVTDSFGPALDPLRDGLALLPGSFCPHYDGEERRRPVYTDARRERLSSWVCGRRRCRIALRRHGAPRSGRLTCGRGRLPRRARLGDAAPDAPSVKKVAVVTSASGTGGTTVGRALAARLGVPFHELDALFWKPGWVEATAEELHAAVEPIVATDAWVIDGSYQSKIGQLVLGNADVVVWLDLPLRVWLPRLVGAHGSARALRRGSVGREPRVSPEGVPQPRLADPVHASALPCAPEDLPGALRRLPLGTPPLAGRDRRVPQERRARALSSAIHAATRSPIQIGVRST